ncbi:unnamed protein product [Larinioides sclopetarius]|uniref:Uncharacterized protein n=1 Tax=Larinioides sclopetarius TaxID=280406 RepID=A0AAV1ZS39_9ARAC
MSYQRVCRNKSLWQFADKRIYISPVFSPSGTKKFYKAQALIKDSKVWVKIPKQCVMDARLSVGCFTRFEVIGIFPLELTSMTRKNAVLLIARDKFFRREEFPLRGLFSGQILNCRKDTPMSVT